MVNEIKSLIQQGENKKLAAIMAANPSYAEFKTDNCLSILLFAAYCRNKEAIAIIRKYRKVLDFHEACALGDQKMVNHLLKEDASQLNNFSGDGFTPLGLACFFGHIAVVTDLLHAGADTNLAAENAFKVSPIHSACAISDVLITKLLLKYGADVNAKQMKGISPLHTTAHNGHVALSKLLLQHGADPHAVTDEGLSPIQMALDNGFDALAKIISKYQKSSS